MHRKGWASSELSKEKHEFTILVSAGRRNSVPFFRRPLLPLLSLMFVVIAGCTTVASRLVERNFKRPSECVDWFFQLDRVVRQADVRDASTAVVPGFPYLRTNRFLTALGASVETEDQKDQWLDLMRGLDLDSRRKEVRNLPDADLIRLALLWGEGVDRDYLMQRVAACSERLYAHDRSQPGFFETVRSRARVPDEYSTGMRVAGLYPLASLPVAWVTERVRHRVVEWFEGDMERLPVEGELRSYSPEGSATLSAQNVTDMIRAASSNALSIPLPSPEDEVRLLIFFAPELVVDVAASYDHFGSVVRTPVGPEVHGGDPTVYAFLSHALLRGKPILQCNYVLWFSERAGRGSPRIERGILDGLTIRISLDLSGRPFMVDIMNNCGCYHFFVPDPEAVALVRSFPASLDPFVPQWLPDFYPRKRLAVRVNSGWHQVQRVFATVGGGPAIPYRISPYGQLESHPVAGGRWVSLFDSRGIVRGSERIEPLIFFPMGIRSIGSMRQRGRHAISLIGREHFDDPRLFDERFLFR